MRVFWIVLWFLVGIALCTTIWGLLGKPKDFQDWIGFVLGLTLAPVYILGFLFAIAFFVAKKEIL